MTDLDVCPCCGRKYLHERHVEECRTSPFSGADTCPMCGEAYNSFLDHLDRCDAGR